MGLSALVLFGFGIGLTFAPSELLHAAGAPSLPLLVVLAQICGALYLGFAILNWMAKDNLMGGIYSRPVAMGNFLHFFLVAMALVKGYSNMPWSAGTFSVGSIYAILAICFGLVLFRHPKTA